MDSQQGPPVQRGELWSTLCGSLDGTRACGTVDTGLWTAESLCCPPETIPTLLIGYTPI